MKSKTIWIPEIGQLVIYRNLCYVLQAINFGGKCRIQHRTRQSNILKDIDVTDLKPFLRTD